MRQRRDGGSLRPPRYSDSGRLVARRLGASAFALLSAATVLAIVGYLAGVIRGPVGFAVTTGLVVALVLLHGVKTHARTAAADRRSRDITDLFQLAAGLAARAHDRDNLVHYAETALERLTGARARIKTGPVPGGIPLFAGGSTVGSLRLNTGPGFRHERWDRLREAILPQLATALETATLVEQLRQRHVQTIAALSRSMEVKDWETSGHTERVADIAVALARRLGYRGADLEAIEVGALLHDVGKIGIPERILHKPGPLDDEEWAEMKRHPVIAEYILSGVDLPPIVREIARSSHERVDGGGYPDGLAGDDIPLAAQIAFVADAFDAITTDRPYRPRRGTLTALDEIRAHSGTQFSREVVSALEEIAREEPRLLASPEPDVRVA